LDEARLVALAAVAETEALAAVAATDAVETLLSFANVPVVQVDVSDASNGLTTETNVKWGKKYSTMLSDWTSEVSDVLPFPPPRKACSHKCLVFYLWAAAKNGDVYVTYMKKDGTESTTEKNFNMEEVLQTVDQKCGRYGIMSFVVVNMKKFDNESPIPSKIATTIKTPDRKKARKALDMRWSNIAFDRRGNTFTFSKKKDDARIAQNQNTFNRRHRTDAVQPTVAAQPTDAAQLTYAEFLWFT